MAKKILITVVLFSVLGNLPCPAAATGDVTHRLGILQHQLHMLGKAFEVKKQQGSEKDIKKGAPLQPISSPAAELQVPLWIREATPRVVQHIKQLKKKDVSDNDILHELCKDWFKDYSPALRDKFALVAVNAYQRKVNDWTQIMEMLKQQGVSDSDENIRSAQAMIVANLVMNLDERMSDGFQYVRHALAAQEGAQGIDPAVVFRIPEGVFTYNNSSSKTIFNPEKLEGHAKDLYKYAFESFVRHFASGKAIGVSFGSESMPSREPKVAMPPLLTPAYQKFHDESIARGARIVCGFLFKRLQDMLQNPPQQWTFDIEGMDLKAPEVKKKWDAFLKDFTAAFNRLSAKNR